MKTLRIEDKRHLEYGGKKHYVLAFDLRDILSACVRYESRIWIAWGIDCIGSHWCDKLNSAPNGALQLSFVELTSYAQEVTQTIDGYFFALQPKAQPSELHGIRDGVSISDLIIHAFD